MLSGTYIRLSSAFQPLNEKLQEQTVGFFSKLRGILRLNNMKLKFESSEVMSKHYIQLIIEFFWGGIRIYLFNNFSDNSLREL